MTPADIQRVEQTLSVTLPRDYKQLLLDYPFSEDSFASACMVINDADALIKINGQDVHFKIHQRKGRWVPHSNHFMIGIDGGDERYYLDLHDPACSVLRFNLETGELSPYAHGMGDYKEKIDQMDREDEKRAAERRQRAKWWQQWKKL